MLVPRRWMPTDAWNQVPRPRSLRRWRNHQRTSSVVVTPGVITSLENMVAMSSCTSCSIRR
jgi:hypothetical protein